MVLGAVAVTYQLDRTAPLQLSGAVLADIFLGRITRWNDPRLAALNPDAPLPALPIRVVHRDDESGTTYIFSDYLSAVSPAWAKAAGRGATLAWPVGGGSVGNEGVAGTVKQTPGAIGYVEVVYARQNRLPVARLQNRAGQFVAPTPFEIASAATAGVGALEGDAWMTASLVNAPGASSYPLVAFSWLLLDPEVIGATKARQLRDFVQWALTDGVEVATPLGYVPLPSVLAAGVQARLDRALGLPSPSGSRPR
jgi:phosphate transport system substrate-binding protein